MKQVFNPYLPLHEYIPDREPRVFGDRVYVFGSHDREGGKTYCELDYVVYSAHVKNLKDWRLEGTVYRASQDPHSKEVVKGAGERKYLYAPDVVQGVDGRYYMYYCLSAFAGKGGFSGPISVAVCDTPAGRYEYYGDIKYPSGNLMLRFLPFDPGVINDNGRFYLYYGWALPMGPTKNPLLKYIYHRVMEYMFHKTPEEMRTEHVGVMGSNVVELEEDMLTVKTEPIRLLPCEMEAKGTKFEGHAFFEASSIRKIGNTYYFIYSTSKNHELCYATSKYPDRGFHYGGVIVSNGDIGLHGRRAKDRLAATGNNHGSIECIDGEWYVFYHRHTHMSSNSRQGCAERIKFQEDGSIPQVEMTSCGLNGAPLHAKGKYPAVIACNLTNGHMPHIGNGVSKRKRPHITHQGKERFITNMGNKTVIGFKYFDFKGDVEISVKTRGKGYGKLMVSRMPGEGIGELPVKPSSDWIESSLTVDIIGIHSLYFTFMGKGRIDLISFCLN
ncbi:Glycosyl hydrolases family 43 [Anaerocolumna jejuensis DSM 15929]|uniref:Glycosyl hydrolases family 43 n=1 Tax=Anaerocolumna jejuensis DSM 15929 TaxID=1121322 RepID=A0A1M7BVV9_9FIRM|nr:family 43 glycosylhydrolase [Anaerocolumna jejuensis]SHL58709.1 Glycosyl hydrolases family 43 [Anaerocolumna jejuensis DSM 15929]